MFWSRKKISELKDEVRELRNSLSELEFKFKTPAPYKIGLVKSGKLKGNIITKCSVYKEYIWYPEYVYRWKINYVDKDGGQHYEII